jgi:hypothetical protein
MPRKPKPGNLAKTPIRDVDTRHEQLETQFGYVFRLFDSHCDAITGQVRKLLTDTPRSQRARSKELRQLEEIQSEFRGRLHVVFQIAQHLVVRNARNEILAIEHVRKTLQLLERCLGTINSDANTDG